MNSWAKGLCVFALSALFFACEEPKEIGLSPNELVGVQFTDTVTVRASTMLLDSVRTGGAAQMLVGNYDDPQFGQVSAKSFFEYGQTISFPLEKTYQYDSVALVFSYSHIYGDTAKNFKLNIHQLSDTLSTKTYYNNSSVGYNPRVFATVNFRPTYSLSGEQYVKLPDDYGKKIFAMGSLQPSGTTAQAFFNEFKGFAFIPDPNNKAVVGIASTSIRIIVYYHEVSAGTLLAYVAPITLKRFNNVQSKKSTALAGLQPLKPVPSSQMAGLAYVQDALGIVTKIELPYIDKLATNGKIAINRAELFIQPQYEFITNGVSPIPATVVLSETDETNRLLRSKGGLELILPTDNATFSASFSPQFVGYSNKYTSYNFTLTTYLQALYSGYKKNKGLLLLPFDYNQWQTYQSLYKALPANYTPYLNSNVTRFTIKPNKETLKMMLFYTKTSN